MKIEQEVVRIEPKIGDVLRDVSDNTIYMIGAIHARELRLVGLKDGYIWAEISKDTISERISDGVYIVLDVVLRIK